jgi:hypothetical protein
MCQREVWENRGHRSEYKLSCIRAWALALNCEGRSGLEWRYLGSTL